MIKSFRAAALAVVALAALAMPALATDLPVDGNLRFQCSTATASGGAATLNNKCGTVTSEALTFPADSEYVLTLTNSAIAAADIVLASVGNGSNTSGVVALERVTPAAGSVSIVVRQMTNTTLNGTLLIKYLVVKP